MYFGNIERLKQDLLRGDLPESESFKYLMGYIIGYGIISVLGTPPPKDVVDLFYRLVGVLLITAFGTVYCYYKNGGANGQHFLPRYLSIGWVISWRCGFLIFLPYIFVSTVFSVMKLVSVHSAWFMVGALVIEVLVCWRTGKHMHDVSTRA